MQHMVVVRVFLVPDFLVRNFRVKVPLVLRGFEVLFLTRAVLQVDLKANRTALDRKGPTTVELYHR